MTPDHCYIACMATAPPYHYYRPIKTRQHYRDEDGCTCGKEFKKCERLVAFVCGHRMHRACAVEALKKFQVCPLCQMSEKRKE